MFEKIRFEINQIIETRNNYHVYSWKRDGIFKSITIEKRDHYDNFIRKWLKITIQKGNMVLSKRVDVGINYRYETILITKDIEELMTEITNHIFMNSMMGEG